MNFKDYKVFAANVYGFVRHVIGGERMTTMEGETKLKIVKGL